MQRYRWPGNLRELRNAIERAVILSPGPFIEVAYLSEIISNSSRDHLPEVGATIAIAELTDEHIRRVLARTTRLEEAADILGIDVATLYRLMRKWQTGASDGREDTGI